MRVNSDFLIHRYDRRYPCGGLAVSGVVWEQALCVAELGRERWGLVGVGVEDPRDVVAGWVVALIRVPALYLPKELG